MCKKMQFCTKKVFLNIYINYTKENEFDLKEVSSTWHPLRVIFALFNFKVFEIT